MLIAGMITGTLIFLCGFAAGRHLNLAPKPVVEPLPKPEPSERPYDEYRNERGLLSVRAMKSTTAKGGGKG